MKFFGSAGLPAFKPPQRLNQSQKRAPAAEDEGQVSAKSLEMLAGMIDQSINYMYCLAWGGCDDAIISISTQQHASSISQPGL